MPATTPSPTTLRLLACVEAFSHQEDGAIGHDDWAGLVHVLERELLLLQRLAEAGPVDASVLGPRTVALGRRYEQLSQRIEAAKIRDTQELSTLGETKNRIQAMRQSYLKN